MIIITKDTYTPFENIPYIKNPENKPDTVFYPTMFEKNIAKKMFVFLKELEYDHTSSSLIPEKQFPFFIKYIHKSIEDLTSTKFNICFIQKCDKIKQIKYFNHLVDDITPLVSFGDTNPYILTQKINKIQGMRSPPKQKFSINMMNGSLLILRKSQKYWDCSFPKTKGTYFNLTFKYIDPNLKIHINEGELLTESDSLSSIYLNSYKRKQFGNQISNGLVNIHKLPQGHVKGGLNGLEKHLKLIALLGTGDWGNVYSSCLPIVDGKCAKSPYNFAVKFSRITTEDLKTPYNPSQVSWHEVIMLRDIIKPIIEKGICPNLPLIIDTFVCDSCDFILRDKKETHPCVAIVTELANGDFRDFLKNTNPTDDELYSALFQIMAGLHAIQKHGQILNNDIKARNILFYNVESGGYWHYKINNKHFYVPNHGKLFVLNDFGVSHLFNPKYKLYSSKKIETFNLGSRYAINKQGIFSPIKSDIEMIKGKLQKTTEIKWVPVKNKISNSLGGTYRLQKNTDKVVLSKTVLTAPQKSFLHFKKITTNSKSVDFFENSMVIPPFEFYNDTQDAIKIFIGGKRSTQKGNHKKYPSVSQSVIDNLELYSWTEPNIKSKNFSVLACYVLANEFIVKFFTDTVDYTIIPNNKKKIDYYKI